MPWIGIQSTANMIFSFGSRITSVLSSGSCRRDLSSSVVPPSVMFFLPSTTWSGMTTSSGLSAAMRALTFLWTTKVDRDPWTACRPRSDRSGCGCRRRIDRRIGHRLDPVDIVLRRTPFTDRIGGDHARGRDDEHRLVTPVAKNVHVVRHLGCGERGGAGCCACAGTANTFATSAPRSYRPSWAQTSHFFLMQPTRQ